MSILDNSLALPKSLTDYCTVRGKAIADYTAHYNGILDIEHELDTYADYLMPHRAKPELSPEAFVLDIDKLMWRKAFDLTNFMQIMDAEEKKKFLDEVDRSPPSFTEGNVRATFLTLLQNADEMFARGIVNVFRKLSRSHRTNTNEPFKVNRKAILEFMVRPTFRGGLEVSYYSSAYDTVNDIDRAFKLLDGKKHVARELEGKMNTAFREYQIFEDDYYRAKAFKNGNLHLQFKRHDLLDKTNRIIHDYYDGIALAARRGDTKKKAA